MNRPPLPPELADVASVNAETGAVTLRLETPIEFAGETVRELTFRRPKMADLLRVRQDMTFGHLLPILAGLCSRQSAALEQLDAVDAIRLGEVLAYFFGTGPRGPIS